MHRINAALWIALLLVVVTGSIAAAQSTRGDAVLAGYMRLYGGSAEDAQSHFESLRTNDPRSLPPWFGSLFALQARIEHDETLGASFEQGIEAFISHAEQRYARSRGDSEALFYLAQAYLLRSTYRFNFEKGVWGAARDAAKSKGFADQYIVQIPGSRRCLSDARPLQLLRRHRAEFRQAAARAAVSAGRQPQRRPQAARTCGARGQLLRAAGGSGTHGHLRCARGPAG